MYFVRRRDILVEMCGAKLVVILLLSAVGLSLAALSPSQEVEVVRCAKAGQVFRPQSGSCQQPLTTGPCTQGLMVVLDTQTLLGSCVERKCGDLDMVWDQGTGQCLEIYGSQVRLRQSDVRVV